MCRYPERTVFCDLQVVDDIADLDRFPQFQISGRQPALEDQHGMTVRFAHVDLPAIGARGDAGPSGDLRTDRLHRAVVVVGDARERTAQQHLRRALERGVRA